LSIVLAGKSGENGTIVLFWHTVFGLAAEGAGDLSPVSVLGYPALNNLLRICCCTQ